MSQYLSNIAARSAGNNTPPILPSTRLFNAVDSGIMPGFADENNSPGRAEQNQFVQQGNVPVQPVPLQRVQQAVVLNKADTKEQERNTEPYYFSKHIEREETVTAGGHTKNKSTETIHFKMELPSQKTTEVNATVRQNLNEPGFVHKAVSKIVPGKKDKKDQTGEKAGGELTEADGVDEMVPVKTQNIKPPVDDPGKNKLLPVHPGIERIIPNQPDQVDKKAMADNKLTEAAPKLVIGKIIVEILPPTLPASQKIITRVVQSASKDSFSKSNKLIFGLGQL